MSGWLNIELEFKCKIWGDFGTFGIFMCLMIASFYYLHKTSFDNITRSTFSVRILFSIFSPSFDSPLFREFYSSALINLLVLFSILFFSLSFSFPSSHSTTRLFSLRISIRFLWLHGTQNVVKII